MGDDLQQAASVALGTILVLHGVTRTICGHSLVQTVDVEGISVGWFVVLARANVLLQFTADGRQGSQ